MTDVVPIPGTIDDNSLSERRSGNLWMHLMRLARTGRTTRCR